MARRLEEQSVRSTGETDVMKAVFGEPDAVLWSTRYKHLPNAMRGTGTEPGICRKI